MAINVRAVIQASRTRAGIFLIALVLLGILFFITNSFKSKDDTKAAVVPSKVYPTNETPAKAVEETARRTSGLRTAVIAPRPTPTPAPVPVPRSQPIVAALPTPTPAPVKVAAEVPLRLGFFSVPMPPAKPAPTPEKIAVAAPEDVPLGSSPRPVRHVSDKFLPGGKMIKCELVFALDSLNPETPVVALVSEDVWQNGKLVVPAGTEVHGSAVTNAKKLRIGTNERWWFVLPGNQDRANGSELVFRATALGRNENDTCGGSWGLDDGAAGLKGYALYNPTRQEILRFIATFGSAGAAGLQTTTQQTAQMGGGTVSAVESTPRNAALGGLTAVLADQVAAIQREIDENKAYVRVPGGTPFYLYLRHTIDLKDARVGDSLAYVAGAESDYDTGSTADRFGFARSQARTRLDTDRRAAFAPGAPGSAYGLTGGGVSPATAAFNAQTYGNGAGPGLPYYASPSRPGSTYSYPSGTVPVARPVAPTGPGFTDLPQQ